MLYFSLKSFKQRLQDHGNLTISLDLIELDVPTQPENPKTEPPASETSENESKLVLHSESDLPVKEDEEKPGAEMIMDLSATPEKNNDTKDRILEATLHSVADGTAKEAAPMCEQSEEPLSDEMKGEILSVKTGSASQHKLKKEVKMVEEENAVSFGY